MDIVVDWRLIAQAVDFFTVRNYQLIDVPWIVNYNTVRATFADDDSRIMNVIDHGSLIGSAEQSFYQMLLDGKISTGKYIACSPCFRNEPVLDHLHLKTFMKVELIHILDKSSEEDEYDATAHDSLYNMIAYAKEFFMKHAGWKNLKIVSTPDGQDIELCGIEIGSYGVRRIGNFSWIYGTAIAEPRFSTALSFQSKL